MGARSLTVVNDTDGSEIIVMYRQMDGYPEGHGLELANFLKGMDIITRGINPKDTRRIANGMSCLAAQIICHFKTGPGGIYLHSSGSRNICEEYIYTIWCDDNHVVKMLVTTDDESEILFTGEPIAFIEQYGGEE